MFLIHFLGILFKILIIFLMYLACSFGAAGVHSNTPLKIINFQTQNPRKVDQKHHQKINNFYFIYKSPRAMLLTAKNTRNDA